MTKPTNYSTFPMPARRRAEVAADVKLMLNSGLPVNNHSIFLSIGEEKQLIN